MQIEFITVMRVASQPTKQMGNVRKNIFTCLFSVYNKISLHVMNKYI